MARLHIEKAPILSASWRGKKPQNTYVKDDTLAVLQRNVKQGVNDGNLRDYKKNKTKKTLLGFDIITEK